MKTALKIILAWLVLLMMTLQGCGVFNKKKIATSNSQKYLSWHHGKEENVKQDCTLTVKRDRIEYNFTFDTSVRHDPVDFKYQAPMAHSGYIDRTRSYIPGNLDLSMFNNIDPEIAMLMRSALTLQIKIDKEHSEQKNIKESKKEDNQGSEMLIIDSKAMYLDKQSDTTLSANIPWFVWMFGILLMILIGLGVWLMLKKKKG